VTYLVLMVVLAAIGIGRLWLIQKRQQARLGSMDGFKQSLERISGHSGRPGQPAPVPAQSPEEAVPPTALDPVRREAARARIQARRRAARRAG
jgi:hypothetical protein